MNLKQLIERHITGTGNGFEVDDILSNDAFPKEIIDRIIEIERTYRTEIYTIGISNPASFPELQELADLYAPKES